MRRKQLHWRIGEGERKSVLKRLEWREPDQRSKTTKVKRRRMMMMHSVTNNVWHEYVFYSNL